jgi:polysaccharide export outer membrane protein
VYLAGNVKRPGVYSWTEGLKLTNILKTTEDLLPQTEFSYAVIERNANQKKESLLVSFNLENILIKKSEDLALLPNDKIIIYNLRDFREQPVVKIDGLVIKPGFYEFYEGMKVSDLILAGRGLRDDSYKERADLYRWNEEKSSFEMIIINLNDITQKNTFLHKRDRLTIHSIWDVVQKEMVEAAGFVNKPGKYLYFPGMKVSDLLFASGSLKEYADKSFANIHRELIDASGQIVLKYIAVDLTKILAGDKIADIVLTPKDKLEVLEISKFIKAAKVTIIGEVMNPGSFQWGEGMRISDLIRIAGGLDKSAYLKNAELTHYEIINGEQRFVAHENISIEKIIAGSKEEDKLLKAYDEVNILKIPGWNRVATVEIKGEILYPGVYTIEKGEKISDLIKRAGGLTENAYPFATFFSREKIRFAQKAQMESRADDLEKRMLNIKEYSSEGEVGKAVAIKDNVRELIAKIRATKITGRVSLSLDEVLKNEESANNLVLEGNDILVIPRKAEVVYVIGEIRNQTTFILNKSLSVKEYIAKAGGFTPYADPKNVYIVRADGSVANFKSSGFKSNVLISNGKSVKGLLPGDTIVIPEKLDRYEGMKLAKDISQIFSQIALSIAAFAAIGVL